MHSTSSLKLIIKMKTFFMNSKNSKTSEPYKFKMI